MNFTYAWVFWFGTLWIFRAGIMSRIVQISIEFHLFKEHVYHLDLSHKENIRIVTTSFLILFFCYLIPNSWCLLFEKIGKIT